MPLMKAYELFEKQVTVGVWEITENLSELHAHVKLSHRDRERLLMKKKEKHQKAFVAARVLLQRMGIDLVELDYEHQNIPILKNGQNISISHTNDYVVIALSLACQIGIDIEMYHSRIIKLAYKFLHSEEKISTHSLDSIKHLTRIWTAKEAMFKAIKKNGVSFKNQMAIQYKNRLGTGKYFFDEQQILFDICFKEMKDHTLCVCKRA